MTEPEALRVLHVDRDCTPEQLRQAYVDLVKVWHPDRFHGDARLREKAERALQRINEAYAVLQERARSSDAVGSTRHRPTEPSPPPSRPERRSRRPVVVAAGIGLAAGAAVLLAAFLRQSPRAGATGAPADPVPSDVVLPPETAPSRREPEGRRPQSGASVRVSGETGNGVASVRNTMAHDAVVVLSKDAASMRAFFIRRGEMLTVLDLVPGGYQVRLMTGVDWDGASFRRQLSCYERVGLLTVAAPREGFAAGAAPVVLAEDMGLRLVATCPLE